MKQILLLVMLLVAAAICVAQKPRRSALPKVGVLRSDQKAGESHDGCGNHILQFRGTYRTIFVSDSEGWDAWMNLNGHNIELTLKETHLRHVAPLSAKAVYKYQYKNVFVTLRFWQSSDYISNVPATLIVQSGRQSRRYRVEVAAQCD